MRILTTIALLLLALPARADDIVKLDGSQISGVRVEAETYEKVTYKKAGLPGTQVISTADVRDIKYGRTSSAYREAQRELEQGNARAAIELYIAAAEDAGSTEHLRATARAKAAELMLNQGYLADAIAQFDALLAEYPKTRHLGRALMGKGRATLRSGDAAGAVATFESLKAQAANLGERWELEAEFNLLLAQQAGGQTGGLAARYEALRNQAGAAYPGIASQCGLQLARLHFQREQYADAERLFDEIIAGRLDTGRDVAAGAYTGRGRCRVRTAEDMLTGASLESPEVQAQYRQALLDFLRVTVHYPDIQAEQPEALYFSARCLQNLAPTMPDGEQRARGLLRRVRDAYPNTPWAAEAGR